MADTALEITVLRDAAEPGPVAMARDLALGRALRGEKRPAVIARIHDWAAPTLTLGRTQTPAAGLRRDADAVGVCLARRPTGGGWLLHLPGDAALTLALGPLSGAGAFRETARRVARAIADALGRCGIPAEVLTGRGTPSTRSEVCFNRGDRDEVAVGSTKVAGVALARLGSAVLVQTALPLRPSGGGLADFERRWDPARGAAVARLAGLDRERLREEFVEALGAGFGATPRAGRWRAAWLAAAGPSASPGDGARSAGAPRPGDAAGP